MGRNSNQCWWNSVPLFWALLIVSAIPLLYPAIPPLLDLPGHIGRFRVQLDIDKSPYLAQWYSFRWALFGNLGTDLLIIPVAKIFGLEMGVKLIVIAIPPLTAAGMLWLAREIHGRIPPTAFFALPLIYCSAFQFGFVNYVLAIALMLHALALWLRMARKDKTRLRAVVFVPIAFVIWLCHSVAWGMFGLIIFALEFTQSIKANDGWVTAIRRAAIACLPLALPALLMIDWWTYRSNGESAMFGLWQVKLTHIVNILRNDWRNLDLESALLLYTMVLLAVRGIGFRLDTRLGVAALLLFVVFLIMPGIVMSVDYADMRILPYAVMLAILAITPITPSKKWQTAIAISGLLFFAVRIAVQTWTYWHLDGQWKAQLVALDHVERGARIFTLTTAACPSSWEGTRMDHLGEMAMARRDAFVNGHWPMPGARLLSIHYDATLGFQYAPSQIVRPEGCPETKYYSLPKILRVLPREAFDYLWLIDLPRNKQFNDPGMTLVWQGNRGALYRIKHKSQILTAS